MTLNSYISPLVGIGLLTAPALSAMGQGAVTSYRFLDFPASSRAFALGGCAPALVDRDILLSDQNPALIGPEIETQAAFSYTSYIKSSQFGAAKLGMAAGERGAWCAGVRYLNYGDFDGYLPDGTSIGTFRPTDLVIEGTYAHDITDRLRGGISYRTVYSNYEQYTALAMGVDLGINFYNPDNDLSLSAVLTNMGGQIKRFTDRYNPMPFDLRLGYMQTMGTTPFRLSVTATNLTDWRLPYIYHSGIEQTGVKKMSATSNLFRHLIFGTEYAPNEKFYLAAGYNYRQRTDMSVYSRSLLSGFSVGTGFRTRAISLGIAYGSPHKAASVFMFDFNWNIGE